MERKPTDKFVRNIVERLAARSVHPSAIGDGALAGQVLTLGTDLIAEWVSPTSGVTDHGLLTGLADDDHPQYHNDARGDARYWPLSTDLATQAELDAHVNDTTDAHDASAISIVDTGGYYTSTDVEGALQEAATSGGASDLDDLSDVVIGTPATGEVLRFNGTNWVDASLVAADVSNFDTQVRTSRLNQMTVPNAAVPMGTNKLTGLAAGSSAGDSLRYEQLFTTGTVSLLGKLSMPDTLNLESSGRQSILAGGNLYLYAATGDTYAASRLGQALLELGAGGGTPADWSMSRTAANEVTIAAGDVLKHDTPSENDNSTKSATTAYVDRATGNASSARPSARIYGSTTSIPTSSFTTLTFATEEFDNDGMATLGTSASRLTIQTSGRYLLTAAVPFAASATGSRAVAFAKNGTVLTGAGGGEQVGQATQATMVNVSRVVDLVAGDYVEVQCWQNSGGSLSVQNTGTWVAGFSAVWVGGTGAAWGNAGALATESAAQAIGNASWTIVTLSGETVDIDGMHSTSSNTSRLTCVTPGNYSFTGSLVFATNSTGFRALRLIKNGTTILAYSSCDATAADAWGATVANTCVPMVAGDYIEIQAYQTSGGSLNTIGGFAQVSGSRVGYQTNPSKDGQQVTGGRVVYTSNYTSASLAAGADSAALCTGLTLTGDGVNAMMLELTMYGPYLSSGTATHFDVFIWDGTIGSGTRIGGSQQYVTATGISAGGRVVRAYVPPFTGSKTFTPAFRSGATSQTLVNQASSTVPTIFTAKWMPA